MWAQLISARLKPGKEGDLTKLFEQVQAIEQPGSGLLRSTFMRDQNDPRKVYMLVVFDTEEHARAREHDQRREQGLQAVREFMAEMLDGPPEFTDLLVVNDRVV
jgi:antibiotic biosynthesis monooxygenase (ABM) superfamily enzyme